MSTGSPYLDLLKNRINLKDSPFSDRASRLLVFRAGDHFTIRLAERWFKLAGQLAAYRQRAPLIDNLALTDEAGNRLQLQVTSYPHQIECKTRIGTFVLSFADPESLLLTLPSASCGLRFEATLDRAQPDRRGGVLRLTGDIRRNVAYTTDAKILRNEAAATTNGNQNVSLDLDGTEGGCSVLLNITPRLGFNRYITKAELTLAGATRRWHEWFAAAPKVAAEYQAQYYYAWWVMRAGLISTRFYTTREAMTPSMLHYVGVWQWDAYFHALAYRYVDQRLAQDQIRIMLDHQREDGMIPDAIHDEGLVTHLDSPVDADVTKPPLIGWSAWKLYEHDQDREFVDEIYGAIVKANEWWFQYNDLDGNGLCEYQHPYSSGLDDSPLWDDGMPVESPDLNTYLFLQQEALGQMAGVLGLEDDAAHWARQADEMARRLVREAWDPERGLFWPVHEGQRVRVKTPFSLFPLLTGRLSREVSDRLVTHLTDERSFWSQYPVPTVAMDDPKYDPFTMWRGPTWVNVNYLLIEGLERSGYPEWARELRRRTLDLICCRDDIYEYYHPETGENPPNAATTFGWSSAVFIDLAIQAAKEAAAA